MSEHYRAILEELYATDPSLKEHEADLIALMERLAQGRSEAALDPGFSARLRSQLVGEALRRKEKSQTTLSNLFTNILFMKKFTFAAGGTLVVVLAFVMALYTTPRQGGTGPANLAGDLNSGGDRIVVLQESAFGPLALLGQDGYQAAPRSESGGGGFDQLTTGGYAMGTDAAMPQEAISAIPPGKGFAGVTGMGGSGGSGTAMAYPAPDFVPEYYAFIYKGEEVSLDDASVDVLRRLRPSRPDSGSLLSQFGMGLIDTGSFTNPKMQSLSIDEDRDFGYSVNINFIDGSISLNENWLRWPHPESQCQDEACWQALQLKPAEVPADAVIIEIARNFLAAYGIDALRYGDPKVQDDWRIMYERQMAMPATDAGMTMPQLYVPDVITVVFPERVGESLVFDEGGMPGGLQVAVNIRHKKVSGVWNLVANRYESSAYAAETDFARIKKIAENGGYRSYMPMYEGDFRRIEIGLGTPERGLVRFWMNTKGNPEGYEVLVPSLIFPVVSSAGAQPYFRKNVIVPLAMDLLNEADQFEPPVRILKPEPVPMGVPESMPPSDALLEPKPMIVPEG
ncbi:MAG: hypothetical protein Q8Q39_05140 [bacterium]|nr:hypothetical protein [bacterium]